MTQRIGDRLTLTQLAIFSSPVLVFQALEMPWRVYLPTFLSEDLGLSLALAGNLLLWIRLFDMAADPLVGWLSDRSPTRFGCRRPWMVAAVPLIMLGSWQVFMAEPGTAFWTIFGWCLVMHAGYSLLVTPHGGWGLEISDDYHERTRISGAKVWFALAGMPLILALPAIGERWFDMDRAGQMALMGWALILITPLSVWLVLRHIPERGEAPGRPATARGPGLLQRLAAMLGDRGLLTILALYALVGLADAASSGTFLFFVDRALMLEGWGSTLLLAQAMVGLVSIPLWAKISQWLGKRRALIGVFAWQAASAPIALLLPAGEMAPLLGYLLVRNLCWGGDYMLLRAMVADLAADRRGPDGARNGGSYYALFNVSMKLAAGLGIATALWLLAASGFSPGNGAAADGTALAALRWIYAVPPIVAGLLGCAILWSRHAVRTGTRAGAAA